MCLKIWYNITIRNRANKTEFGRIVLNIIFKEKKTAIFDSASPPSSLGRVGLKFFESVAADLRMESVF